MFLTAGLYLGEQQKLTPGLYVGQAVPSTLTGSIPVQKNYRPGFGFAVSFRIPKTDAPKTKSTATGSSKPSGTTPAQTSKKKQQN